MLLLLFSSSALCFCDERAQGGGKVVTDHEIELVKTAIIDEIYSLRLQKSFIDIDRNKVPLYVKPVWDNAMIWVVYKLMPYGEVLRGVQLCGSRDLALLVGDPAQGFPAWNGAATKTLYLKDDDVIQMKTTWKRSSFEVKLQPAEEDLQGVRQRKELRDDCTKKE